MNAAKRKAHNARILAQRVLPIMIDPLDPKQPHREYRYVCVNDVPKATRIHIVNLALVQGYFHDELAAMFDITPRLVQEIVEAASPDDIAE
jgi:hypothetical protein